MDINKKKKKSVRIGTLFKDVQMSRIRGQFKCVLQIYVYWRLERDSLIFGDSNYHKNILRTLWSYIEHNIFKNIKQFEINKFVNI